METDFQHAATVDMSAQSFNEVQMHRKNTCYMRTPFFVVCISRVFSFVVVANWKSQFTVSDYLALPWLISLPTQILERFQAPFCVGYWATLTTLHILFYRYSTRKFIFRCPETSNLDELILISIPLLKSEVLYKQMHTIILQIHEAVDKLEKQRLTACKKTKTNEFGMCFLSHNFSSSIIQLWLLIIH